MEENRLGQKRRDTVKLPLPDNPIFAMFIYILCEHGWINIVESQMDLMVFERWDAIFEEVDIKKSKFYLMIGELKRIRM